MSSIPMLRVQLSSSIARAKRECRARNSQRCKVAWDEVEEISSALAKKNRVLAQKKKELQLRHRPSMYESLEDICTYFPEMEECESEA